MVEMPIDVQLRYRLFRKRYRIVFEIVGNSVYIYDIQDCRQDSDKNLLLKMLGVAPQSIKAFSEYSEKAFADFSILLL